MAEQDNERLASLEAKMDYIIKSVDTLNQNLSSNYMPRIETENRLNHIEKKIEKIEGNPNKWLNSTISAVAVVVAIVALIV